MNKQLIIILIVFLLLSNSCMKSEDKSVEEKPVEDSLLLSLVLKHSQEVGRFAIPIPPSGVDYPVINESKVEEGGYTVVAPQTSFCQPLNNIPEDVEITKKYILENIKIENYDISRLVELLFERNKVPVRLSLKSSPKDGYIIDNEGKYEKYFEKYRGRGELYKEYPKANGRTTVSLPAYDKKTNILLIYIEKRPRWISGSGWVIAYKYKNGKLKELANVMMWIS